MLKLVSFLPASIKWKNPMQKYPHITELFACTQKILTIMFLFPINSSISSETCSTPKLSSRFITDALCFIFLGRLFLECF